MLLAAPLSAYISDEFGRRRAFVTSALFFLLGLIVQVFAHSFRQLVIGRIIAGVGAGIGSGVDSAYIAEISPAANRGEMVAFSSLFANVGIILGHVAALLVAGAEESIQWRGMLAVGIVIPIAIISTTLTVLLESPRYLVLKEEYQTAWLVLLDLHPKGENVHEVVEEIGEALERERIAEEEIGWRTLLRPTPAFRRMLLLGWGMSFIMEIVGIDSIQYYLVDMIKEAGMDTMVAGSLVLVGIGIIKIQCILICSKLVDRVGRRFFVFLSLFGMAFSLFLVSLSYSLPQGNAHLITALVGMTFYLASYGIGIGPVSRMVTSEVFATGIRAKANSVAVVINAATGTLMASTMLITVNTITWPGYFTLVAWICLAIAGILYYALPETTGHSLEEMSLYFAEITGDFSVLDAKRSVRVAPQRVQLSADESIRSFSRK
ncbi:Putative polyol transporter 2 [Seminavis robusta]|uniref:Hexose transporter 1 n=1 Tax=Seminavis robusta TaxID=568900 RepID=A0A9N8DKL5_9STRA|nr:Putative polyol transporter 2 [Seminavis robusta]|eukprot:Sro109_g054680.1 Putative polyol transporter 2 (434) ;mRNA; f:98304-99772